MSKYKKLFEIFTEVKNEKKMGRLLNELLTPRELEDIRRRWQVLEDVYKGVPQREIAQRHKMSLCKITRGSRILHDKESICKQILEKRIKK